MPEVNGVTLPFLPAGGIDELSRTSSKAGGINPEVSFKTVFDEALNKIKFSAHAQTRMDSRDITMSQNDMEKLNDAFNRAEDKGAKDSLILLDDKAFIANIPNRTVVTVVDKNNLSGNVFTNIDSAVIA